MHSTVYAIGDVHGRSDLLGSLIEFISRHATANGVEPRVFFLGDIVDRGFDSRGAMEIVRKTLERWPASRFILGNHDEAFRDLLATPEDEVLSKRWLVNGGRTTLFSYMGFDIHFQPDLIADILARFPDHRDMLINASDIETVGRYAFVHGGIDALLPALEQDPRRTRRIRNEFLDYVGPLSHIIVHGHTTLEHACPTVTENRVSLDTDAWITGVLSVAIIDAETDVIEFFATGPDGRVAPIDPIRLDRGFGTILDRQRPLETARSAA